MSSAAVVERAPRPSSALASSVSHDFRRAWRGLLVFELGFKLLEAWLLVPALGLLLSAALARSGRAAVSNTDILDFLLSPAGLVYAAVLGIVAVALLLLEQAGIMVIAALSGCGERPPLRLLPAVLGRTGRAIRLSAIKVAALALTLAPFVLLAALTYALLLTQHDIYFYLKDRPPRFWLAASIGAILLLAAVATGVWLCVQFALALPILLFEKQAASTALRASRERVRGAAWRVGAILVGWQVAILVVGALVGMGFRLIAAAALAAAGDRPTLLILLLLIVQGALLAAVSFVAVVGQALITRRIYLERSEKLGTDPTQEWEAPQAEAPARAWVRALAMVAVAIVVASPLMLWATLPKRLAADSVVQVTAHRGHARAAPENTLSAMQRAIESGADYAEMDVQQTADGVVVLLHDRDLKRVAGVSRRLDEMSYDEVRQLDVGTWFDPAFAGERVPTLEEVIEACRGRIRMNIELKFYSPDRRLAEAVARIIRQQGVESECLITSLEYDGLVETKRHGPQLRTGLTVATALGDVSRLDVDALSVRADFLSDELLASARRLGREVHVWTINDAQAMAWQIKRGVDNIITSDPDLAISVRDEWTSLSGPERLLLSARLLLGLQP